jgi:serine/threonine-protein kinase
VRPAGLVSTKLAQAAPPAKLARPVPTPVRTRRRTTRLVVLLVVACLVATGLGSLTWYLAAGRWTTVPFMLGATEADARIMADDASLTINTLTGFSETVKIGQIASTNPAPGARVRKQTAVTVVISKGPERYSMPTVVGLSAQEARDAILSHSLQVGVETQVYDEVVPEGFVVSASQETGTELKSNTAVDLVISLGRQPIPITSYVGKTLEEATAGLGEAGFQVTTSEENSPEVPEGAIISQSPNEGNGYRNDTIALVVSKGPIMVEVPEVFMLSRADATAKLSAQGFFVNVENVNPLGLSMGFANSTDPPAGTLAPQGSTITLNII